MAANRKILPYQRYIWGKSEDASVKPLRPVIESARLQFHGPVWHRNIKRPYKHKKRNIEIALIVFIICGAEGETRTRTGVRPLDPEPSASTSSATSAQKQEG